MNIIFDITLWITYLLSLYFCIFLMLIYIEKKPSSTNQSSSNLTENNISSITLPQEPLVTILVPAYNEEKTILKTLESINNLDYPKDKLQVIAINDGSKDNTENNIKEYIKDKPHFSLLTHANCGKAASLNLALKQTTGEFFACLDADSFVHPQTLKKMLQLYYNENDPQLAIVTPAMKVHEPKNILQKIQWLEYNAIILIGKLSSQIDSLYVAPGPFSIYRTDIIKKIGDFDEHNITEDQEIAYRVQENHYRLKQCVDGYVYTTAPQKIKAFYRQRRRWYLGSIICVHKYKHLIANRKYGDFGMMQMIKNATGYLLAITGIIIMTTLFLNPFFTQIKQLFLTNFNLLPYLQTISFKITFFNMLFTDFRKGFLLLFLLAIGVFLFYEAHRQTKEKINKFGWIPVIPYFAFYYTLKAAILILALGEFATGKKLKW